MPTQGDLARTMNEMEMAAKWRGVLEANKHLNFVERALNPSAWPQIDNGDGTHSSHRMAYSDLDNGVMVYPTIVWDEKAKKLQQIHPKKAARHALKTGEYIRMSLADAEVFSNQGYKLGAGMLRPSGGLMDVPRPQAKAFGGLSR